jgi:hypothetical protein
MIKEFNVEEANKLLTFRQDNEAVDVDTYEFYVNKFLNDQLLANQPDIELLIESLQMNMHAHPTNYHEDRHNKQCQKQIDLLTKEL